MKEDENEAVGDLITSFLRSKTIDLSVRLRCSLAGDRNTMSFYMGAALQLFGRPWDKLYHVLVSPEFESNPQFFYKPLEDAFVECRLPDGAMKKLNTKDAEIHLAELPFIRLRNKVLLHGGGQPFKAGELLDLYFTISTVRQYGGSRYGIVVEKGKIRIDSSIVIEL